MRSRKLLNNVMKMSFTQVGIYFCFLNRKINKACRCSNRGDQEFLLIAQLEFMDE